MAVQGFTSLYDKYYSGRGDERLGLFKLVAETFKIQRALYAGSFVHVTPSLIIPEVVYVDSDKQAKKAFAEMSIILDFLKTRKEYESDPQVTFHASSYIKAFDEAEKSFDLLISQYAGFVSQHCKRYLRIGGILLVNNSHGDASMAYLDEDYKFVGAINHRNDRYKLTTENLEAYFVPKKVDLDITKEFLEKYQRGIGYTKTASIYLFERIK